MKWMGALLLGLLCGWGTSAWGLENSASLRGHGPLFRFSAPWLARQTPPPAYGWPAGEVAWPAFSPLGEILQSTQWNQDDGYSLAGKMTPGGDEAVTWSQQFLPARAMWEDQLRASQANGDREQSPYLEVLGGITLGVQYPRYLELKRDNWYGKSMGCPPESSHHTMGRECDLREAYAALSLPMGSLRPYLGLSWSYLENRLAGRNHREDPSLDVEPASRDQEDYHAYPLLGTDVDLRDGLFLHLQVRPLGSSQAGGLEIGWAF